MNNLTEQLLTLKNNEEQLRLLIDKIQEFIVVKDGVGHWIITNKQVLDAYGLQDCTYQGKTDLELAAFSPAYKEAFEYNVYTDSLAWEKGSPIQIEKSFYGPDGIFHTWEVVKTPIFDESGNRHHLVIVSRKVTERKKAEAALQESEANYRLIAENIKDIIMKIKADGTIDYLSPSFGRVLGHSCSDFIMKDIRKLIHEEDIYIVNQLFHISREYQPIELRFLHKQDNYIWFEASYTPIFSNQSELDYVIVTVRDISERKKYEEQLKAMAYCDHLTAIPNRRFLMEQLPAVINKTLALNETMALIYVDIDHFKAINDTLGHEVGDELLQQFTTRIQAIIKETDIIARIGGDEFIIALFGLTSREEVDAITETLCHSLKQPWSIQEHSLKTTSSIGVSLLPHDGTSLKDLIRYADRALYKSKQLGRGRVQFYNHSMFP